MKTSFNVLGVILARAGSVGLSDKHLQPLLGRPVIEWTLDHVRASPGLTRVVVSTDCPTIRRIAHARGLTTIHRPAELATSEASVQDALLHALDEVERHGSFTADAVACVYGNVPARPDDVSDRCIDKLRQTGCCSVRSYSPVGKWHPQWMSELDDNGVVHPLAAGSIDRRQDLKPLFLHDGAGLVMRRQALELGRTRRKDPHAMFGTDRRGIEVAIGSAVEVDTARDLSIAEATLRSRGYGRPTVRLAA